MRNQVLHHIWCCDFGGLGDFGAKMIVIFLDFFWQICYGMENGHFEYKFHDFCMSRRSE